MRKNVRSGRILASTFPLPNPVSSQFIGPQGPSAPSLRGPMYPASDRIPVQRLSRQEQEAFCLEGPQLSRQGQGALMQRILCCPDRKRSRGLENTELSRQEQGALIQRSSSVQTLTVSSDLESLQLSRQGKGAQIQRVISCRRCKKKKLWSSFTQLSKQEQRAFSCPDERIKEP